MLSLPDYLSRNVKSRHHTNSGESKKCLRRTTIKKIQRRIRKECNQPPNRIIVKMSITLLLLTVSFYLILSQLLYTTKYSMFWEGLRDHTGCQRTIPTEYAASEIQMEYQCHQGANQYLDHLLLNPDEAKKSGNNETELQNSEAVQLLENNTCLVITTTHASDQSAARNRLDYFNVTLSSLLQAYDVFDKDIDIPIIVFEYTTSEKQSYKKDLIDQIRTLHPRMNIYYQQNIASQSLHWSEKVTLNQMDALQHCRNINDRIDYAVMLEDDVVVGTDLFEHLDGILDRFMDGEWFYIKLFHTEFWNGWSHEQYSHVIIFGMVFASSVLLFHLVHNRHHQSCGPQWNWRLKWNRNVWATLVIYISVGISSVWFVIGVGKQNIDFHLWRYDQALVPVGTSMAQASLYDLRHLDNVKEYYQEQTDEFRMKYPFDVVVGGYSRKNDLLTLTYFPSLVQHIGRASTSEQKNMYRDCNIRELKQAMTFIGSEVCH